MSHDLYILPAHPQPLDARGQDVAARARKRIREIATEFEIDLRSGAPLTEDELRELAERLELVLPGNHHDRQQVIYQISMIIGHPKIAVPFGEPLIKAASNLLWEVDGELTKECA